MVFSMISGFHHDVDEMCTLLGYYVSQMETSVKDYRSALHNAPEEYRSDGILFFYLTNRAIA
jgi:hypothetical protein